MREGKIRIAGKLAAILLLLIVAVPSWAQSTTPLIRFRDETLSAPARLSALETHVATLGNVTPSRPISEIVSLIALTGEGATLAAQTRSTKNLDNLLADAERIFSGGHLARRCQGQSTAPECMIRPAATTWATAAEIANQNELRYAAHRSYRLTGDLLQLDPQLSAAYGLARWNQVGAAFESSRAQLVRRPGIPSSVNPYAAIEALAEAARTFPTEDARYLYVQAFSGLLTLEWLRKNPSGDLRKLGNWASRALRIAANGASNAPDHGGLPEWMELLVYLSATQTSFTYDVTPDRPATAQTAIAMMQYGRFKDLYLKRFGRPAANYAGDFAKGDKAIAALNAIAGNWRAANDVYKRALASPVAENVTPRATGDNDFFGDMSGSACSTIREAGVAAGAAGEPMRAAALIAVGQGPAMGARQYADPICGLSGLEPLRRAHLAASLPDAATARIQSYANAIPRDGAVAMVVMTMVGGGVAVLQHDRRGGIKASFVVAPELHMMRAAYAILERDPAAITRRDRNYVEGIRDSAYYQYQSVRSLPRDAQEEPYKGLITTMAAEADAFGGQTLASALAAAKVPKGAELVVITDPALGFWPYTLARDPATKEYLATKYVMRFAPSLASLTLAARQASTAAPASAIGMTRAAGAAPTPMANSELSLVSRFFTTARTVEIAGARRPDISLEALKTASHWHFASHGAFDQNNAMDSGLIVAPSRVLSIRHVLAERGKASPRLVVLSACEGAVIGFATRAERSTSLPSAFIEAGAAGVLAARWPVGEFSTGLLMSRFYQLHVSEGLAPAAALHRAQQWLRTATGAEIFDEVATFTGLPSLSDDDRAIMLGYAQGLPVNETPFSHPYFWAGFELWGA